jgi:hypothetical protein
MNNHLSPQITEHKKTMAHANENQETGTQMWQG